MRLPLHHSERRDELDVTMTPMIDVVFLLLIFFVWTASFQIVEHLLPSHLTATAGAKGDPQTPPPPPDFDQVVVRIVWLHDRPGWIVNDNPVKTLAEVRQTLVAVAQIKTDVPLILDPEPDVPLGHVIDLYDLSRIAGFTKIQFAASEAI